ncbi:unnamed protein product [Rhizoctonia solani]|uniref:Ricin B lectin domain-containing protein n=1 Tax=Rhizoctonia solani TaxID=456999 RepID=A0A8H2X2Q4_9AGAM|nr:unnamed protein product [Rhizoctonia solani]
MAPLPLPGPYQITQPNEHLLSLLENFAGSPVKIMQPTGNPGEQEWHLQNEGDSITLRNIKHNLYAGVEGDLRPRAPIVGVPQPFKWKLENAAERFKYFLYIDSDDGPLYLEYSLVRIFPPRAALSPQPGEPWILQFLE